MPNYNTNEHDEIFIFTCTWQRDSGECGNYVSAFRNFDDAQKFLEEEMKGARQDFSDLETEETEYAEGDMSWSIWESGEYCYNHCDLEIRQVEVHQKGVSYASQCKRYLVILDIKVWQ